VELFGVHDEDKNDMTVVTAEITNNTAVMMTSVEGDGNAIGYISLGSLNDTVKALKIDGADATVQNVADGSYAISRPFNIVTMGTVSPSAQDFINFILSKDGQDVVEAKGYIRLEDTGAYAGAAPTAKIAISGSSSVSPAMESLREAYLKIYPSAVVEIITTDSSGGINDAINGISDIGMASRELKDSEAEKGLASTTIAMDGIAVIVNNSNPLEGLTKEQVKSIYEGGILNWEEV
jgi:phosphate transport system substrate-binding protein